MLCLQRNVSYNLGKHLTMCIYTRVTHVVHTKEMAHTYKGMPYLVVHTREISHILMLYIHGKWITHTRECPLLYIQET